MRLVRADLDPVPTGRGARLAAGRHRIGTVLANGTVRLVLGLISFGTIRDKNHDARLKWLPLVSDRAADGHQAVAGVRSAAGKDPECGKANGRRPVPPARYPGDGARE